MQVFCKLKSCLQNTVGILFYICKMKFFKPLIMYIYLDDSSKSNHINLSKHLASAVSLSSIGLML